MIYLTPSLNALDSDSAVNIVGAQALKALKASGRASWNGVTVILETKRKRQARGPAIVFAPYASLEMLANVEADHRTADFVFVPWAAVELRDYSSAHPNSQVIE
ncbi:MAG: hypothetical protein B7Z33_08910 [Sphingomonadales bacterium 12-68-11]|nr:MAG: hypothetical protein B7Z33_08910 [Sphingomonadales bacterium 12-68-11]